jgi:hypothetical protein
MTGAIKTFHELPQARRGSAPWRPRGEDETREVPLVGMVRNPRSHRNKGREAEDPAAAEVITETTHKRKELAGVLDRFARQGIDLLAVDGGDGTVRDVLTSGAAIFGESWPPLIVLPKGKTNALAADLGLPGDWSLTRAIELARPGRAASPPAARWSWRTPTIRRRGCRVSCSARACSPGQPAWASRRTVSAPSTRWRWR